MCFGKAVLLSVALAVQNLSLIFALSLKSKTNILIEILLSLQFKHKTKEDLKPSPDMNALILKINLTCRNKSYAKSTIWSKHSLHMRTSCTSATVTNIFQV